MVRTTYTPIESLERIKLFMNYDSSKTLIENKQSLSVYDNSCFSNFLFEQSSKSRPSHLWKTKSIQNSNVVNSTVTAEDLINNPILDTLRWIRRNVYTNIGLVVDVLTAIIPYTVNINKLAWTMIIILDIYELISNTNDPLDAERTSSPYAFLIMDLISLLFVGIAGVSIKPMLKGTSKFTSESLKMLHGLIKELPKVKNLLKTFYSILIKMFPKIKPIFDEVLNGVDKILVKSEEFIRKLASDSRLVVGGGVITTAGTLPSTPKYKLGSKDPNVRKINRFFIKGYDPDFKIDKKMEWALTRAKDNFTKDTETCVKKYEEYLVKNHGSKNIFGVITVDGAVSDDELIWYNIY